VYSTIILRYNNPVNITSQTLLATDGGAKTTVNILLRSLFVSG